MALFNAEELLRDAPEEKALEFVFKNADKVEFPLVITLKSDKATREAAKKARDTHITTARYMKTRGKHKDEIQERRKYNFEGYCNAILDSAYAASSGDVLDVHSIETVKALVAKYEGFAAELASEAMDFFISGDAFQAKEDEEDKKK